ncbi:MAG: sulfotransferase family protein, partial [Dongiaceae bacterium]
FGPCHHMLEVFAHPAQAAIWRDAAEGRAVDWDALFAGYGAAVDWPSCYFWRQLSDHYPHAKIVLTVRDADSWYASMSATIGKLGDATSDPPDPQARASWPWPGSSSWSRPSPAGLPSPSMPRTCFAGITRR